MGKRNDFKFIISKFKTLSLSFCLSGERFEDITKFKKQIFWKIYFKSVDFCNIMIEERSEFFFRDKTRVAWRFIIGVPLRHGKDK